MSLIMTGTLVQPQVSHKLVRSGCLSTYMKAPKSSLKPACSSGFIRSLYHLVWKKLQPEKNNIDKQWLFIQLQAWWVHGIDCIAATDFRFPWALEGDYVRKLPATEFSRNRFWNYGHASYSVRSWFLNITCQVRPRTIKIVLSERCARAPTIRLRATKRGPVLVAWPSVPLTGPSVPLTEALCNCQLVGHGPWVLIA